MCNASTAVTGDQWIIFQNVERKLTKNRASDGKVLFRCDEVGGTKVSTSAYTFKHAG